ncbi:hypothetical protein HGP17_26905 [Rhizobium sp. P38BS-XIX]|uniref:hypothetical protein n=1 Tax=Rhizobium sp. P38BS-XIX TaxID=2726740 RepID=UPI0018599490|nr:hypothetical protein [Rhizobium sp. P38BS-XIX]NLS00474.1 hypothetical protein [Rhizobium sp. P38BS-XIX]
MALQQLGIERPFLRMTAQDPMKFAGIDVDIVFAAAACLFYRIDNCLPKILHIRQSLPLNLVHAPGLGRSRISVNISTMPIYRRN